MIQRHLIPNIELTLENRPIQGDILTNTGFVRSGDCLVFERVGGGGGADVGVGRSSSSSSKEGKERNPETKKSPTLSIINEEDVEMISVDVSQNTAVGGASSSANGVGGAPANNANAIVVHDRRGGRKSTRPCWERRMKSPLNTPDGAFDKLDPWTIVDNFSRAFGKVGARRQTFEYCAAENYLGNGLEEMLSGTLDLEEMLSSTFVNRLWGGFGVQGNKTTCNKAILGVGSLRPLLDRRRHPGKDVDSRGLLSLSDLSNGKNYIPPGGPPPTADGPPLLNKTPTSITITHPPPLKPILSVLLQNPKYLVSPSVFPEFLDTLLPSESNYSTHIRSLHAKLVIPVHIHRRFGSTKISTKILLDRRWPMSYCMHVASISILKKQFDKKWEGYCKARQEVRVFVWRWGEDKRKRRTGSSEKMGGVLSNGANGHVPPRDGSSVEQEKAAAVVRATSTLANGYGTGTTIGSSSVAKSPRQHLSEKMEGGRVVSHGGANGHIPPDSSTVLPPPANGHPANGHLLASNGQHDPTSPASKKIKLTGRSSLLEEHTTSCLSSRPRPPPADVLSTPISRNTYVDLLEDAQQLSKRALDELSEDAQQLLRIWLWQTQDSVERTTWRKEREESFLNDQWGTTTSTQEHQEQNNDIPKNFSEKGRPNPTRRQPPSDAVPNPDRQSRIENYLLQEPNAEYELLESDLPDPLLPHQVNDFFLNYPPLLTYDPLHPPRFHVFLDELPFKTDAKSVNGHLEAIRRWTEGPQKCAGVENGMDWDRTWR